MLGAHRHRGTAITGCAPAAPPRMRVRTGRFENMRSGQARHPRRSKYAMVSTLLSSMALLRHQRWQLPARCLAISCDVPTKATRGKCRPFRKNQAMTDTQKGWGGARKGAGRKQGTKNPRTIAANEAARLLLMTLNNGCWR